MTKSKASAGPARRLACARSTDPVATRARDLGLRQHVKNRPLAPAVGERAVAFDDLLGVLGVLGLEQAMELAEVVVGDRWEEVVGDVDVLAIDEHSPAR